MMMLLLDFSESGFGEHWQSQHSRRMNCTPNWSVRERSQSWHPLHLSLA
jgi:hypothetical protein